MTTVPNRSNPPPVLPPRRGGQPREVRPPPPPAQDSDDSDTEDYVLPVTTDGQPDEIYDDCGENDEPETYDDCSEPAITEEVYDDCQEDERIIPPKGTRPPPPLPETQELYDDCQENQASIPPKVTRPPPPLPTDSQENYDDLDNVGPIVQQLPRKPGRQVPLPPPPTQQHKVPLPPPPQDDDVYEDPDASKVPPPPGQDQLDDVYELSDNDESSSVPAPPPLPPQSRRGPPPPPSSTARPPAQPKPPPAAAGGGGVGFSVDPSQLMGLKKGLRKVSDSKGSNSGPAPDTKTYGEIPPSVSEARHIFHQKSEDKPGLSPKPALFPKHGAKNTVNGNSSPSTPAKNSNSNTTTNNKNHKTALSPPPGPKSPPAVEVVNTAAKPTPDVTFFPKLKDKHSNVPLPPVPSPPTPAQPPRPAVTHYQPPPQELEPPEDIYDDAHSGDPLDKYDWFHSDVDRKQGESRVKAVGKDGTYLVRPSAKDQQFPYTLVVMNNGHVNNLRIRRRPDAMVALGDEKPDELAFTDILALILHHKNHHVVLLGSNSSQVKLQHFPPKR